MFSSLYFFKKGSTISLTLLCSSLVTLVTLSSNIFADQLEAEPLTKVYKAINADGSVSFSDQPNAKSETLLVPPVPTVPAIDPKTATSAPKIQSSDNEFEGYTSMSILAPANESAFYSAAGEVDVIVDVKPALLKEDKLEFYLDNQLVKTGRQLQVRLPPVNRGTHQLKVKLLSSDGKLLKESVSSFTVHKPSIRN